MNRIVVSLSLGAVMAVTLSGCGGGGGGGGGGNTTTPEPGATTTTSTSTPTVPDSFNISVLSYNNQGWNIEQNNLWDQLDAVIDREGPFDLMGMQECPDGRKIISGLKQEGAEWNCTEYHKHCTVNPTATEDVCIVWDTKKYRLLEEGLETTMQDGWCHRWTNWARFEIIWMQTTVLFVNSHGAVHQCDANENGQKTYDRYVEIVNAHRKEGDILLMTGDWNCPTHSLVVQDLLKKYAGGPEATPFGNLDKPDHIFHDPVPKVTLNDWKAFEGAPSDHQGLKAHYTVSTKDTELADLTV